MWLVATIMESTILDLFVLIHMYLIAVEHLSWHIHSLTDGQSGLFSYGK